MFVIFNLVKPFLGEPEQFGCHVTTFYKFTDGSIKLVLTNDLYVNGKSYDCVSFHSDESKWYLEVDSSFNRIEIEIKHLDHWEILENGL